MAEAINVTGPHVVQWKATTGGSYVTLGRGDNNDLFKFSSTMKYLDVQTNEYGDMPAESVITGAVGTVNFSLVSWDAAEVVSLRSHCTAIASSNLYPVVGTTVSAGRSSGDRTITIFLNPDTASKQGIEIHRVRLLNLEFGEFGNRATRLTFSGEVMPDGDTSGGGTMYSITNS